MFLNDGAMENNSALVWVMACCQIGDDAQPQPMLTPLGYEVTIMAQLVLP